MIAKLITFGKDREAARQRMLRAIDEYQINGVKTTLSFCKFTLEHEAFISGNFDTNFVKHHFKPEYLDTKGEEEDIIAALLASELLTEANAIPQEEGNTVSKSNWKTNRS